MCWRPPFDNCVANLNHVNNSGGSTVVIDNKQINLLREEIFTLKNQFEKQKLQFNEINKFVESEKQSRTKR